MENIIIIQTTHIVLNKIVTFKFYKTGDIPGYTIEVDTLNQTYTFNNLSESEGKAYLTKLIEKLS
jgi:hypothetical protein